MADAARTLLMAVVFPLWVATALVDWACHRRTRIERTSGLKENLIHLLMTAQVGLGMVLVAVAEVNAGVLLAVLVLFLLHELTVYWDLRYTVPLREVGPFEQMVHSFLELLPLVSLALLAAAHWDQALALFGLGDSAAQFRLRWKDAPLPPAFLAGGLLAALLFCVLPLLEETWRCWNHRKDMDAGMRSGMTSSG